MGSEAKTYEGIKVLILASYPAISGISQNKIQGIEKNIGSINNVKTQWKWMLIFISCILFPFFTIISMEMILTELWLFELKIVLKWYFHTVQYACFECNEFSFNV